METKYTFWELIKKYKIEIPKIQRDYAQGRKEPDIEKIVSKFLDDIINSIINNDILNLDFVYGKVENDLLIPLDGQQRLTTLFLIHWYLALKENKLSDDVKDILLSFTYEIRISSEDFCKNLVSENINYKDIKEKISDVITDSKWYFLSWELDPTVSAMLNMLDTIHSKVKDIEEQLFEKLTNNNNITFHFLPLEQFKLTDELYIKMNARGKPLTEFENFKANFSNFLKSIEDKSKLDNEWLDIFWNIEKNRNTEINTENVDKMFFNFFQNITLNFYTEKNTIDRFFIDSYNLFDIYNEIYSNDEYINQIIKVLNGFVEYKDDKKYLEKFITSSPNYWERLRFYSLSLFFLKYNSLNEENIEVYNNWIRITSNLINNTLIQSATNFKDALTSIKELSNNINDIYSFVSNSSDKIKYFSKIQKDEEGIKAKLILEDNQWKTLINNIEEHSYFDGQIGFILKYSKENEKYNKNLFIDYSQKLSKLFSDNFKENYEFLFQRALLAKGDYLPQIGHSDNYTFCVFEEALRSKMDNWRKVFNDDENMLILKELLDNIDINNIKEDLEKIINNDTVNDWRRLIITNPDNISYCQYREIRWYSEDEIYLLSKKQMNGKHREIYSWDLFIRKFNQKEFKPFTDKAWYWESTSWDKSCVVLSSYYYEENRFAIEITYDKDNKFFVKFTDWNDNKIPDEIRESLEKLNIKDGYILLSENEIDNKINDICKMLDELKE